MSTDSDPKKIEEMKAHEHAPETPAAATQPEPEADPVSASEPKAAEPTKPETSVDDALSELQPPPPPGGVTRGKSTTNVAGKPQPKPPKGGK